RAHGSALDFAEAASEEPRPQAAAPRMAELSLRRHLPAQVCFNVVRVEHDTCARANDRSQVEREGQLLDNHDVVRVRRQPGFDPARGCRTMKGVEDRMTRALESLECRPPAVQASEPVCNRFGY